MLSSPAYDELPSVPLPLNLINLDVRLFLFYYLYLRDVA